MPCEHGQSASETSRSGGTSESKQSFQSVHWLGQVITMRKSSYDRGDTEVHQWF